MASKRHSAKQDRVVQKAITGISQLPQKRERKIIDGRWEVERQLGKGGQGTAFRVVDTHGEFKKPVVLKQAQYADRKALGRFDGEVAALRKLSDPNIVKILASGFPRNELPYYVMPLMEGGDLNEFLKQGRTVKEILRCFASICRGVATAHKENLIHRDLKPENILFDLAWVPHVADFGICIDTVSDGARLTSLFEKVGPRFYVAPELREHRLEEVRPSSDIYSLGKVLWFMLAPAPQAMFDREDYNLNGHDLCVLRKESRMRFVNETILSRSVVPEPSKRFQDASEMLEAVESVLDLVEKGYEPLSMNPPMHCRFCGRGELLRLGNTQIWSGVGIGDVANVWRALACTNCGNVQLFRMDVPVPLEWLK